MVILGIDIGGSGIKAAPVDVKAGELLSDRYRLATPRPAKPEAVMDVAAKVAAHFDWTGPIGCAFPGVVSGGVVHTAANVHNSWIGTDGRGLLVERTGCRVHMLNDADAAGIAEMSVGAGKGRMGLVIMFTFGTGIGSALFMDGHLIPNTELGHLEFKGEKAEHRAAARLFEDGELSLEKWTKRLDKYLQHVERLLRPELIIFGGGVSKQYTEILPRIKTRAELVPAKLFNHAGIAGAALAAHEAFNGE